MKLMGIVVLADVVGSRRLRDPDNNLLAGFTHEMNAKFGRRGHLLQDFVVERGDQIAGVLSIAADPFELVMLGTLDRELPRMRWVVSAGIVDQGKGHYGGPAFWYASDELDELEKRGRTQEEEFLSAIVSASEEERSRDWKSTTLAPWLMFDLEKMTQRQAKIVQCHVKNELKLTQLGLTELTGETPQLISRTLGTVWFRRMMALYAVVLLDYRSLIRDVATVRPDLTLELG